MSQNFDPNQNYYSFIDNNTDPLVFIHGVGLDHEMWEPQIKSFNDHSIITYDLLGHGRTPYDKEEITLNDFSNQLVNLSSLDILDDIISGLQHLPESLKIFIILFLISHEIEIKILIKLFLLYALNVLINKFGSYVIA